MAPNIPAAMKKVAATEVMVYRSRIALNPGGKIKNQPQFSENQAVKYHFIAEYKL
jgi:hypothetical protein